MTTATALVERARRLVLTSQHVAMNRLTAGIDADDTTLTFDLDTTGITAGQYIEIDFELMLVTERSAASVMVLRGMDGSTAAVHATGALVRVRPILSNWDLYQSMGEELADLSSPMNGLYRVTAVNLTPTAYPLSDLTGITDAFSVVRVRQNDAPNSWPRLNKARLELDMDTADFPSGIAVRMDDASAGKPVRVWVRRPFGALTTTGVVETETGIPATAVDILAIGAAYRSILGREHARSLFETQGDSRRAGEVPPGAERQGLTPIAVLRRSRIDAEKARLDARWTD